MAHNTAAEVMGLTDEGAGVDADPSHDSHDERELERAVAASLLAQAGTTRWRGGVRIGGARQQQEGQQQHEDEGQGEVQQEGQQQSWHALQPAAGGEEDEQQMLQRALEASMVTYEQEHGAPPPAAPPPAAASRQRARKRSMDAGRQQQQQQQHKQHKRGSGSHQHSGGGGLGRSGSVQHDDLGSLMIAAALKAEFGDAYDDAEGAEQGSQQQQHEQQEYEEQPHEADEEQPQQDEFDDDDMGPDAEQQPGGSHSPPGSAMRAIHELMQAQLDEPEVLELPSTSSCSSSAAHSSGMPQAGASWGRQRAAAAPVRGGGAAPGAVPLQRVGVARVPDGGPCEWRVYGRQFYPKQAVWWQAGGNAFSYQGRVLSVVEGDGTAASPWVYMVDLFASHPFLRYVEADAQQLHPLLRPGDAVWAKPHAVGHAQWSARGPLYDACQLEQGGGGGAANGSGGGSGVVVPAPPLEPSAAPWLLARVVTAYCFNDRAPVAECVFDASDQRDRCYFNVSQLELVAELGESSSAAATRRACCAAAAACGPPPAPAAAPAAAGGEQVEEVVEVAAAVDEEQDINGSGQQQAGAEDDDAAAGPDYDDDGGDDGGGGAAAAEAGTASL